MRDYTYSPRQLGKAFGQATDAMNNMLDIIRVAEVRRIIASQRRRRHR